MRLESIVSDTVDSRYFDKYPRNLLLIAIHCESVFNVVNQEIDLLNIVISNLSKRVITKVIIQESKESTKA